MYGTSQIAISVRVGSTLSIRSIMQLVHATDNYALDQVNHNSNHMLKHNSNHMLNLSGDQPLLGDQRPGKKTIA